MTNFKNNIKNILLKIFTLIAYKFRYRYVLYLVKIISNVTKTKYLIHFWDPNVIRVTWNAQFNQNLYTYDFKTFSLDIDLNDHIGYYTYMNDQPFDTMAMSVAKVINLKNDSIFLDIGANTGTVSIPLCAEIECQNYAIEASKLNASLLLLNTYKNRIKSKVLVSALVGPDEDEDFIPLYIRSGNTGSNSIKEKWNPSKMDVPAEFVPTCTLDSILSNEEILKIGLIKIDVEGAEYDVLSGAKSMLKHCKAPILMEYRIDATQKYLDTDYSNLLNLLVDTHTIFNILDNLELTEFDSSVSSDNVLAVHNDTIEYITNCFKVNSI